MCPQDHWKEDMDYWGLTFQERARHMSRVSKYHSRIAKKALEESDRGWRVIQRLVIVLGVLVVIVAFARTFK